MIEELNRLSQLVTQHDKDIQVMRQTIQESTTEMVKGQKELTASINSLTMSLQRYIDKHDRVEADIGDLAGDVRELRDIQHTNQPLIDGIRAIHGKLLLVVISALASPAAILAILAQQGGK